MFSLVNAAQVKLGRRDVRLLIDLGTVAHEHARPYLPGELTQQIDQVLGQLRLGQVSAEGHANRPGEPQDNDLDRVPGAPSAAFDACRQIIDQIKDTVPVWKHQRFADGSAEWVGAEG